MTSEPKGSDFDFQAWRCPICKTNDEKVLGYRGGSYQRHGQGVPSRIVQCRKCSLLYSNPFPIPNSPQTLYGDPTKYFEHHDEAKKVQTYRALLREIKVMTGLDQPSVLDVGSGRGELLEAAKQEKVDAVGLEFSSAMIEYARKRYGIEMIAQSIEDYAAKSGRVFDAVILSAVLEHVYDPDSMIAAASKLMVPGGVMYLDLPQEPNLMTFVGNWVNRLCFSRAVYNLSPTWSPFHVYGFNKKSLQNLLGNYGFEITAIKAFATTRLPSRPEWRDRFKAWVGAQLIRIGNLTGTSSNLNVWAKRRN